MKRLIIGFSLLLGTLTLAAQELTIEGGRFQKGDNPAWSAAAFDDSAWREVTGPKDLLTVQEYLYFV